MLSCLHELMQCGESMSPFLNICNHKWNTWMVSCLHELMKYAWSCFPLLNISKYKWNSWMAFCLHEQLQCGLSSSFYEKILLDKCNSQWYFSYLWLLYYHPWFSNESFHGLFGFPFKLFVKYCLIERWLKTDVVCPKFHVYIY